MASQAVAQVGSPVASLLENQVLNHRVSPADNLVDIQVDNPQLYRAESLHLCQVDSLQDSQVDCPLVSHQLNRVLCRVDSRVHNPL